MNQDIKTGYKCQCCGQFVKEYHRKINSSMALVIFLMYKHDKKDFFHVEKWLKSIGKPELRADYHKLRFWGLIEAKVGEREDGSKRNGFYKITGRGIMFAEGKLTVPEKAVLLNNVFQRFEGGEIKIKEAMGNRFNYDELMNGHTTKKKDTTPVNNPLFNVVK